MSDQPQPQQHTWRANSEENTTLQSKWRTNPEEKSTLPSKHSTHLEINKRRFLNSVGAKYSKRYVSMKAAMLDDLLSKFVARKNKNLDGSAKRTSPIAEEQIKDTLNRVLRPKMQQLCYKKLQNAARQLKENDNKISDLVTQIQSSKFKITSDPNVDFNVNHGISTMSCFDKTPREVPVDIDDGSSLDSRPDMTEKLENVCLYCDSYDMNESSNNTASCSDFVEKTMSLDIDGNVSASSQ